MRSRSESFTWRRVAAIVLFAGAAYLLRPLLAAVGLQATTFILPVLVTAYCFGSRPAVLAAVLALGWAHFGIWRQSPQLFFTGQYFRAIFNFTFFNGLILAYTWRHERVLRRLDSSLERERAARAESDEANRLKDEFLATLSHELRTPINVMLGYLDMLLSDRAASPRRATEIVYRNAQQQARLIEDVLDASRIAAGTFTISAEPVVPAVIVREVAESVQPSLLAKQLQLQVSAAEPDLVIMADPQRLRQVFWNVLSNAIKFTPPEGRIAIRVAKAGGHVEITVEDTGRGIAPQFLPFVFDMFRQADASTTREVSGMGLGLTLVKRFVELQGGAVAIDSPGEGRGTTFTCRFPLHRSVPAALLDQRVGTTV